MRRSSPMACVFALATGACFSDPPSAGTSAGSTGTSTATTTEGDESTSTGAADSSSSFETSFGSTGTTFGSTFGVTTDFDTSSSTGFPPSESTDAPPQMLCEQAEFDGAVACADFEADVPDFGWEGELSSDGVGVMPVEGDAQVGGWFLQFNVANNIAEDAYAQRSSVGLGSSGAHGSAWVRTPGSGAPVVVLALQWTTAGSLSQVVIRADDGGLSAFYTGPTSTTPLGEINWSGAGPWHRFTFSLSAEDGSVVIGEAGEAEFGANLRDDIQTDDAYTVVYGTYLEVPNLTTERDFDLDGIVVFEGPSL